MEELLALHIDRRGEGEVLKVLDGDILGVHVISTHAQLHFYFF